MNHFISFVSETAMRRENKSKKFVSFIDDTYKLKTKHDIRTYPVDQMLMRFVEMLSIYKNLSHGLFFH